MTIAEAMAVEERGASLPIRVEGAVLHVGDGQSPLPSLALVVRFDQAAARIDGVTLSAAEKV